IDCAAARRGSRWAGRFALFVTESQEEPLGMGMTSWNRLLLTAGPSWRAAPGGRLLDGAAGAVGALGHGRGGGYTTARDEYGFDPGVGAGVRLALPPAPLVPWIGLSSIAWLRREALRVDGVPGQVELPSVDVLVTAGISFGVAR